MSNSTFDSNYYARELKDRGIPEPTAQALVELKVEMLDRFAAIDARFDAVDVRFDNMSSEMNKRFELQEERFDKKLAKLKNEILVWMFGFFSVQFAATLTMIHYAMAA